MNSATAWSTTTFLGAPMRLEQRIGRIDRFGQGSEKVLIFNFITPDTVEERIFFRCFERLGIFATRLAIAKRSLATKLSPSNSWKSPAAIPTSNLPPKPRNAPGRSPTTPPVWLRNRSAWRLKAVPFWDSTRALPMRSMISAELRWLLSSAGYPVSATTVRRASARVAEGTVAA